MVKYLTTLLHSPLFKGMNIEELGLLMQMVHYQVKQYPKGTMVVQGGDSCDVLYVVLEGSVRGEMSDAGGRVLKIEDIYAPMPLAVAFLFGSNNQFPVTITSNDATTLLALPRKSVIHLMQRNEVFLINFMNAVSNRAQFISDRLRFHSFQSLKGKIADYLLNLSTGNSGIVFLDKTQEELAELFGVARPSLGRALKELRDQGLIKPEGKRVEIINREALRQCIGQ